MKRVSSLHVYPIKSLRGVSVTSARMAAGGFARDRRYMLTDASGRFLSQRTVPELTRFSVSINDEGIAVVDRESKDALALAWTTSGPSLEVSIWQDSLTVVEDVAGSDYFSRILQRETKLCFLGNATRLINPEYREDNETVTFADGYPYLALSIESLRDLNRRCGQTLELARFRPNIVLEGGKPYDEDKLQRVMIGEHTFRATKLCERCVMTTLNPNTGVAGKEPLATLAEYRKWDGKVWFGTNLVGPASGALRVGDPVQVIELKEVRN